MAHIRIALRVGADLREEPHDPDDRSLLDALHAGDGQGIDGGLDIVAQDERVSWPDVWDRVDGMLVAWLEALDAIAGGAPEAIAELPDTRVEILVLPRGDKQVRIEYEDIDATVDVASLKSALEAAAGRLLTLTRAAGVDTPALKTLASRGSDTPAGR